MYITEELTKARRENRLQAYFGAHITGLRWHRRRHYIAVPCFGYIRWSQESYSFKCNISKRYWGWQSETKNLRVMALGRSQEKAEQLLITRMDSQDLSNPDRAEEIMTGVMHHIAEEDTTVGRDCMAILLKRTSPHVGVRYLPYLLDKIPVALQGRRLLIREAFSPWVVTPILTAPPSIIVGHGWSFPAGDLDILVDSPERRIGFASFKTMVRRPWP